LYRRLLVAGFGKAFCLTQSFFYIEYHEEIVLNGTYFLLNFTKF
jgi:hypothetical protein